MHNQIQPNPLAVSVKPPQLFLFTIILGGFLQLLWPITLGFPVTWMVVGLLLLAVSLLLLVWASREFR
jgi:protein-S-isoprenylcysteine O-methyltransferase Ste14